MRLEVKSIGKKGFNREDIAVYDADTGQIINGIQSITIGFNVDETATLELKMLHNEYIKTFDIDEETFVVIHMDSGKEVESLTKFSIDDKNKTSTISVNDFDLDLNILRPYKEYGCHKVNIRNKKG